MDPYNLEDALDLEDVPVWIQSLLGQGWWHNFADSLGWNGPITQPWVDELSLVAKDVLSKDDIIKKLLAQKMSGSV